MSALEEIKKNPWAWVPTLYFIEGIPYFLVNEISVMMFKRMGVPNGQMALFTSLIYLPWVIKPFWSPFVDIIKTKRWWITTMQVLMVAMMVLLSFTLPTPTADMLANGTTPISMFSVTLILFIITAFASATHDIAADGFYMLALSQKNQSAFVGIRSTFYRLANIFGNGVLVWIAGYFETHGNIPQAWRTTMWISTAIMGVVCLYHLVFIPRPASDRSSLAAGELKSGSRTVLREFFRTFATFFKKPGIWLAIAFMLLYRLPEAFLLKMCKPFLVDPNARGGLEMTTQDVGLAYGTLGVFAILAGGILGGILSSRIGLKKSLWWMAAGMTLPCLTFVYLSTWLPTSIISISTAIIIEQFGYGFGFTAYMLYMMYFSEGEFKTSHYAICTGFMALSMMIPGMFAGYLQEAMGYAHFFWMAFACSIATVLVTYFVDRKIDPDYGKKGDA